MLNNCSKNDLVRRAGFDQHFSAETWAEYNRKFFDALAPKYDFLNEVITLGMHKRYKENVVDRIPVSNGDLILDVCTGSGDLAIMMAGRFSKSHVIGVDVSSEMLTVARKRFGALSNIEFRYGDAMRLPFADKSFDACVMGYGLRNLTDFCEGIKEMVRVTRPGGSITILDLGKPSGFMGKIIYKIYFEILMPFLGRHIFHRGEFNSFQYLPESNRAFPSQKELAVILQQCGLEKIVTHNYMWGIISQQVGYAKA